MIIDTICVKSITRELTDLMRAYNIQILTVQYEDFDKAMTVSYRANRIFEANEFKELAKILVEPPKANPNAHLVWSEVKPEYFGIFTESKKYKVISFHGPINSMAKIIDDNNNEILVSIESSVYGENQLAEG